MNKHFIVQDVETRQCEGCFVREVKCIRLFPGREQPVWACGGCLYAAHAYVMKPVSALDYLKLLRDEMKAEPNQKWERIDKWVKELDNEIPF